MTFYYILFLFLGKIKAELKWREFGTGLNEKIAIPIRHFFVEVTDENDIRVHARNLEDDIVHTFLDADGKTMRVRNEWGITWDGLFLFRFKAHSINMVWESGWSFQIEYKKKIVLHHVFGATINEFCSCPEELEKFKETFDCPSEFNELEKSIKKFGKIDLDVLRNEGNYHEFISKASMHYVVKDQKLYKKALGHMDGFSIFTDSILLGLLRRTKLPDVDFIFDMGDWPTTRQGSDPIPVFCWAGSDHSPDIVLPTWDQIGKQFIGMGRSRGDVTWILHESGRQPKWEDKIDKGLFRGRDSNLARLTASELSLKYPDLIDAGLTSTAKRSHDEEKWGPKAKYISLPKHGEYKYQILLDGTVAPFRSPALFMHNSLILKQDSEYYEWWYKYLEPNVHFIPLKRDISDLVEKLKWAKENDDQAKKIAEAGSMLARKLVMGNTLYCAYAKALEIYSKQQNRPVAVYDDMTLVDPINDYVDHFQKLNAENCYCPFDAKKDEL